MFRSTGRQPSEEDLKKGVELAPGEWRCWYALTQHYAERSEFDRSAATAKSAFERFPANHILGLQYAKALLDVRRYQAALDLLAGLNVLPYENASEGHALYERANLELALERIKDKKYEDALALSVRSREWPERLGAGKPYSPDERIQDWIESYCLEKLGKASPRAFDKASLEKLKQELKTSAPWKYELLVSLQR